MEDGILAGIITMSDVAKAIEKELPLSTKVTAVMTADVVEAPSDIQLFEVIRRFKEREIGRLIIVEGGKPVGILTQSDIIRVFPSL
jgi:predicted transcriptional regulator